MSESLSVQEAIRVQDNAIGKTEGEKRKNFE